jgi:hypothetical protein
VNFADLVKEIDGFMSAHGQTGGAKMKSDLLELVQKAIAHGESKEQNKISGIVVKGLKALIGGSKD